MDALLAPSGLLPSLFYVGLQIAVFPVPERGTAHTLFKLDFGREAQITPGPFDAVDTTIGQEFDAAAREGSFFALETRSDGEDVRRQVGQPERDIAGRQFSVHRMRDSRRQFADGHGTRASNIIAAPDSLWLLSGQHEGVIHVINIDRMQHGIPAINDTKQPLLD